MKRFDEVNRKANVCSKAKHIFLKFYLSSFIFIFHPSADQTFTTTDSVFFHFISGQARLSGPPYLNPCLVSVCPVLCLQDLDLSN